MEVVVTMAGVAPVRLLGPVRAFDARTSHRLSSSASLNSRASLFLFLHRTRLPSVHSQSVNWRLGHIRGASVQEVDEEEPLAQREKLTRESAGNSGRDERFGAGSSSRFRGNGAGNGDAQKRNLNSRNQRPSSFNRREGGETERAAGRYAKESPRSSNSRYSQNEMGRNVQHRAPWEQGPRDRRPPPPANRVSEGIEADEAEELNYEDSRLDDGNYQGGGPKSAMARIVEKLRAIGNDKSLSRTDFNKNRPATETSVFLPR